MLHHCLTLGLALAPQSGESPTSQPEISPPIETNENGWPELPAESGGTLVPLVPADEAPEEPAATAWALPAPPGGAAVFSAPSVTATALDSPLRDMWLWVGQPPDFHAQGGARAEIELHLFDEHGAVVHTRSLVHEADLGRPDRDRLTQGRRTYGRDGPSVWATLDGVAWHSREREARELLSALGVLMRLPWSLSDPRYEVSVPEELAIDGVDYQRVIVRETTPSDPGAESQPHYELIYEPGKMLPVELRFRLEGGSELRRVLLSEYQTLPPAIRVPVRRRFVTTDGKPLLELEIVRMQCRLEFERSHFRPPVTSGSRAGDR